MRRTRFFLPAAFLCLIAQPAYAHVADEGDFFVSSLAILILAPGICYAFLRGRKRNKFSSLFAAVSLSLLIELFAIHFDQTFDGANAGFGLVLCAVCAVVINRLLLRDGEAEASRGKILLYGLLAAAAAFLATHFPPHLSEGFSFAANDRLALMVLLAPVLLVAAFAKKLG